MPAKGVSYYRLTPRMFSTNFIVMKVIISVLLACAILPSYAQETLLVPTASYYNLLKW